ncbi:hypothetical protein [Nocardiopsis alba]|uniref:WXG100-like domain-containing protein n=1 Tax=Nocardiopsis alba TaxID=53437 RepID=UPI0033EAC594
MELPPELRNLFSVLTGSEWPTADETRLWELAQVYGTAADRLEVELPQLVIRIKNKVRENFDATAADFFDESVDQFTAGERNYLGEGTAVARGLQEYVHNAATQVQYAKWMIIGQLVQLALEIAWAIAMAPYTFGASLAKIPIFKAITKTVIGRVLFRLFAELLQQMAISQFFALTLDALIQRIQIDNGYRDEWDHKLTEDAAKGAMLDGFLGTAAAFGGSALSNQFNKLLNNTSGPAITKQLDDHFPTGGPGKGLPEGIGDVMGRNSDDLLRPYGMDNRPGWNRPIDAERFRNDMGNSFADSLGDSLGRNEAREFGDRYADAFSRNWGKEGLNDALSDVVNKYGRNLDPKLKDFLTNGVPGGVRDGLSDVGSHWKNFLAQLGGGGIANAAQGMLSEGLFNLLFSDEKTFSITWLSGVSGLVSGAVQQSLTQGGLLLIDQLKNAGPPPGVPTPPPPTTGAPEGGTGEGPGSSNPAGGPPSESGSSTNGSSTTTSSNDSSSTGEGGGDSRGSQNDGASSDQTSTPPPPQQVTTESSDTSGRSDNGTYRPAAPPNDDGGSNESSTTGDTSEQSSDRPVNTPDENDSDHLNRGDRENTSSENEDAGDAPVIGDQNQDNGDRERPTGENGDGEGSSNPSGPEGTGHTNGTGETPPQDVSNPNETGQEIPGQEPSNEETSNPATPVQGAPNEDPSNQDTSNPNTTVEENPGQGVPDQDPQRPPSQDAPLQEGSEGGGVVREPNGSENAPVREVPDQETSNPNVTPNPNGAGQETPNQGTPDRNAPVRENPNEGPQVQESPNPNEAVQGSPNPSPNPNATPDPNETAGNTPDRGSRETPGQEPPNQNTPDRDETTGDRGRDDDTGSHTQPPPATNPAGQGANDGGASTHRPNGAGNEGASETTANPENTGSENTDPETRPFQDDTGDENTRSSDSDTTVSRNPDDQGASTHDDSGATTHQNDGANGTTPHPEGGPAPVVMAPQNTPHAQGGPETTGDGRRGPAGTPPAPKPRPDPDAPATVSEGLRPPTDWQNLRDDVEPTRVGANRDRSGVDTDGVEILHGSSKDDPIVSIAERGFDVRRIPLPNPDPDGPTHVTELTIRMNFDTGPGVTPEQADTARRNFMDRLDEVVNQRYRLPGNGDQLHIRVEQVGPDGRPHSGVTWVHDNPDLPGRSDTANWRLDDGVDVWLHEALHRVGLNDEYRDPSQERSGRPPAVFRASPDSSAVHEVGGYMDAPGGRDGRPPQILNHYLDQIENQVNGASRYDGPTRLGDLPNSVHRDLAALLDPDGTRNQDDTIALFGAAYDNRVRGRGDDQVRADLPDRLKGDFDRVVGEWTSDGRWDGALDRARGAGMESPLSRMPSGPTPVTTESGGNHRAAGPFSDLFKPKGGGGEDNGGGSGKKPESHPLKDLWKGRGRGRGTDDTSGESSGAPPRETRANRDQEGSNVQQDLTQQVPEGSNVQQDLTNQDQTTTEPQDPPHEVTTETTTENDETTSTTGEESTSTPEKTPPKPVSPETSRMLDMLADIGPISNGDGYSGLHVNPDVDVQGLRRRLTHQLAENGVRPDAEALANALDLIGSGRARPDDVFTIPVHDASTGVSVNGNGTTPPPRGEVRLTVDREWRDTTGSPDRRLNAGNATENRAKDVGTGAQQGRKSFNPGLPITVIGEIFGKVAMVAPKLKTSFAVRQRGNEFQMSAERRHKRKVDVDGDDPSRFTGDMTVSAVLEVSPLPSPSTTTSDQRGADDRRQGTDEQEGPPAGPPTRVEFSDRLNDVVDVVLAGHVRDADADPSTTESSNGEGSSTDAQSPTPERQRPPERFRTDDGNGAPVKAPRFSRTIGILDGGLPKDLPIDMRTLRDNLGKADQGKVLRFPYQDDKGNTQYVEISGGPVSYERVGPEMKDSSFSDTDKFSNNAQNSAGRTNKEDFKAGAAFIGTIIPGDGSSILRVGPEVTGGVKGTQKYTRGVEHGSERIYSPGSKGDSAFYRVNRTYTVTTTEDQPSTTRNTTGNTNTTAGGSGNTGTTSTAGNTNNTTGNTNTTNTTNTTTAASENTGGTNDTENGGGSSKDRPTVRSGTFDLTTLDQVTTADALAMASDNTDRSTENTPAEPTTPGLNGERVDNVSEAVPLRSEWSDGRLRDSNGESPSTVAAKKIHQQVFDAHPELVTDPSGAKPKGRGFWRTLWQGADLRVENTLKIYEMVGAAIDETGNLIGDGTPIHLRTGGLGNALTPAPGTWRSLVEKMPGTSSIKKDDRDGADFITLHLEGKLTDARFEGSRSGGSLSTGLNASTAQAAGKQNTTTYSAEATAMIQTRVGSTAAGLPKGIFEVGGGYSYENENATPLSGNRKAGVEASSSAKGDLETWSYELELKMRLGTDSDLVDVTPESSGTDPKRPRILLEGPKTVPVSGERAPITPTTDRDAEATQAREAAREALETAREARRQTEEARAELNRLNDLAGRLGERENALTQAEKELESREKKASQDDENARNLEDTAAEAEKQAGDLRTEATRERADAAQDLKDAAERRREAIEDAWAYVDALQTETDSRNRPEGEGTPPPGERRTPPPLPDLLDTGVDALGENPDRNAADQAWNRALDNWNALNDAERQVADAVRDAESAYADATGPSSKEGDASGTPTPRPTPESSEVYDARTKSEETARETRDLKDKADAQSEKASGKENEATAKEEGAAGARSEADTGRQRADESAEDARQAARDVETARNDRNESVAARDRIPGSEERLTRAREQERLRHDEAATAQGREKDHRFAQDRDTRLRPPPERNEERQDQDQNRPHRSRADLDLDGLPHAPKHSTSPGLKDRIHNAVSSAPGYTAASRSGEAVMGHWNVLSSPKALAAHTMDVHDGGLPLKAQFEDGTIRRSNVNVDISAERKSMHTSDAVLDGGIDLTYKSESDRITGSSDSSGHNVTAGLKGEAVLNQGDSRNNRLRGSAGATPYASKQTTTKGDTNSFGGEDKLSFGGSTVKVTTSDEFQVHSKIRTQWNAFVSVPITSTTEGNGSTSKTPLENGGDRNRNGENRDRAENEGDGENRERAENERNDENRDRSENTQDDGTREQTRDDTESGTTESRYRVLDLAQKNALPSPEGLDGALGKAREIPKDITFVPGNETSGYALNGIDTKAAVDGILQQVKDQGVELTEQSKSDIRAALSAGYTRGDNLRLQTGGLVLPVNVREGTLGGQRFSSSGWLRLGLSRDGDSDLHSVEAGLSSERSVSESSEHNESKGKQKKKGVTAGLDGGWNPVAATGTDDKGAPTFPKDRYQTKTLSAGTGWESATTSTELTSDTDTKTTSRTIKAPGITATTPMKIDFTLSLDHWYGSGSRGAAFSSSVNVGPRTEVFQTGTFLPDPPKGPSASTPPPQTETPRVPTPFTPTTDGAKDISSFATDWRNGLGRDQTILPMVEAVGQGPIADAALIAEAKAMGWNPDASRQNNVADAVEHLRRNGAGSRGPMLGAAVDGHVLRGLFGHASGGDGATLVGKDPYGPFVVPGLETKLFTQIDPDGATIIGATGELSTGKESTEVHRDERSVSHSGSTALTHGADLSGMKAVDQPVSDFQEGSALIGGGTTGAGSASTAAGGGKQSASTVHTVADAPVKGRGYLVRFPVDALLVAQHTGSDAPKAETTTTTVDVWLSLDQVKELAGGVSADSIKAWDGVADRQDAAAKSEKELNGAVDKELGLDRSEEDRRNARKAMDLLSFDPSLKPSAWSDRTSNGVEAIRDYLGLGAEGPGWDRSKDQDKEANEAAQEGLKGLREDQGTPHGLSKETVDALSGLIERRADLLSKLREHRETLDTYFEALRKTHPAYAPTVPPSTPTLSPTDTSGGVDPAMLQHFMQALSPSSSS